MSACPETDVQIGCGVHELNPVFTQYLYQGAADILDMESESSRPVGLLLYWIDRDSTLYLMPSQWPPG